MARRRPERGLSEELSARTELFEEVVAALLEFGDDRFLLFGLAEHQRAVLRVCRAGVVETGTEVADGLLQVLDLSLDTGQLGAGVVVRVVVCHLFTLMGPLTGRYGSRPLPSCQLPRWLNSQLRLAEFAAIGMSA